MTPIPQNPSELRARLVVEELVRCGVTHFVIVPGFRSSPLVSAVARHPTARTLVHFDERGAAFAALGIARGCGEPAALITTSGTAVMNAVPAVVEASMDGVPLVLLTADRPSELQRTGANQTVDQLGVFRPHVRWELGFEAPGTEPDSSFVLTGVDQAVHRARTDRGPVHLNLRFREPLTSEAEEGIQPELSSRLRRWWSDGSPFTSYLPSRRAPSKEVVDAVWDEISEIGRGLVVGGRLQSRAEGQAVRTLAEKLGWPLFADILSGVRLGDRPRVAVEGYDLLLSAGVMDRDRPEAVIHVGERAVSKKLYEFLDHESVRQLIVVSSLPERMDPIHRSTRRIECDVRSFCTMLSTKAHASRSAGGDDGEHLEGLLALAARARDRVSDILSKEQRVSEPAIARVVCEEVSDAEALFVGSSMPVRDLDAFATSGGSCVPVAANRGVSGIDGTVASAVGLALGRGGPVTVVLGDLALLHDLNSLALVRSCGQPITVVVLNNNGGGIFSFLPIAEQTDVFEKFFGAPHGITFESAAKTFGLEYEVAETVGEFVAAYRSARRSGRSSVIEVVTDRTENRELHDRIVRQVRGIASTPELAEADGK